MFKDHKTPINECGYKIAITKYNIQEKTRGVLLWIRTIKQSCFPFFNFHCSYLDVNLVCLNSWIMFKRKSPKAGNVHLNHKSHIWYIQKVFWRHFTAGGCHKTFYGVPINFSSTTNTYLWSWYYLGIGSIWWN